MPGLDLGAEEDSCHGAGLDAVSGLGIDTEEGSCLGAKLDVMLRLGIGAGEGSGHGAGGSGPWTVSGGSTVVEKVACFKFLGVHITDKLKWSTHTDSVVKKAEQRLFNLRRLKKFGLSPKTQAFTELLQMQAFTDAQLRASCRAVSPPGTATAPPTTTRLSRG